MLVTPLDIPGPFLITTQRFEDARGSFTETFREDLFVRHAGAHRFVQDNHSISLKRGTLRGLHFQRPPRPQGKLVRVTRGAVFDVAVDIRHGSPTYGRHVWAELSAANGHQLWVPPGFLHGFCTLEDGTECLYKVTDYYSVDDDRCALWNDPDLAISWPFPESEIILSDKDRRAPRLRDLPAFFRFAA